MDGTFELLPQSGTLTARSDEQLIEQAAVGRPTAMVWQAGQGLVVPRTYRKFDGFEAACDRFARDGWPVSVRLSGGGIVPQGPGILNLSLAWRAKGRPLDHSDDAYLRLCDILAQAIAPFGIDARPAAVAGSFCDGRFNLAVGSNEGLRKIAGTAQLWRRLPLQAVSQEPCQVVLAHALILVQVDIADVTARANLFESLLGSERRYRADRAVSLSDLAHICAPNTDLISALRKTLAVAASSTQPPRGAFHDIDAALPNGTGISSPA